ncbi:MAG: polysaccharide biosynthesis C-terminal domain-containing protein [Bacteroidota bacterium]|nr:polysaccharide biosynthesis C-terminal domain-containing protein [Bacteroidota bacterium]MDP4247140.1 polysaccharide biosynthesis C-terminal domain-containing protein [Bacteroidota bacterium]MDP4252814.1 polysaccharide biosynthesis C-terminal domain-containing protein [Bacteroidota bacterium]MDP4257721.1 polysaccharide biosynthesis C-terminal domain-containing protein [Bacteroidota bacterium]
MSSIRRQSIISSTIVYSGFALGFLNTYLFTRNAGGFTAAQYGLTVIFMSIASIMFSVANLGMQAYIYKFYPYYDDHLPPEKNDMMSWVLLIGSAGFMLVVVAGLIFKNLVIRKFGANSGELVHYYYWIFPFGFGLTLYSLLESFAWQLKLSVLTNYLREIQYRLCTLILIALMYAGLLKSFDLFIKIYSFTYLLTALTLLLYLVGTRRLHFTFSPSKVTKRFLPKIRSLALLVWSGGMVYNISFFFAQIVIAAVVPGGLTDVGIFTLAQYIASIIQAPQRGIISASIAPLSKAWKDKDYAKINRIYHRSSINQLIFSVGIFILIWINFTDGVITFHLKPDYFAARYIFLFIGLTRIVDMGTGVNTQIIGTSTFWRFDFLTGIILIALTLPFNYLLAKRMGMVGPAIADLITFTIYNGIRYLFLYRKFGMQPFTVRTLYALLLGLGGYAVCHFWLLDLHGYAGMILRSAVFIAIYAGGILALRVSEDVLPVWRTIRKRLGIGGPQAGR